MTRRRKSEHTSHGRNPNAQELLEAERFARLTPAEQRSHPRAVPSDRLQLSHINTYGDLPEFYIDRPFICRLCGKREIWKARDQKWYVEETKGHINARAVECHACRKSKRHRGAGTPTRS